METFRRYEKKYLLNEEQYLKLMDRINDHVKPDRFFEAQISSIYFDTADHQLIRRSIEKPDYKEKLRARSYRDASGDDKVFVELKKKYDGIVYKRRSKARCAEVLNDLKTCRFKDEQVGKEIRYALSFYGDLKPSIYIGSSRTSYIGTDDEDLRITFDEDLRYRNEDLCFSRSEKDKKLTDLKIMELKIRDAMPLWLSGILDEIGAYPWGFSKVGNAYMKILKGE